MPFRSAADSPDPLAAPTTGRFNEFQRTMLQWSRLHPYSAVHVVQLSSPVRLNQFHAAIESILGQCGLGQVTIDSATGAFRFSKPAAIPLPRHRTEPLDPLTALEAEIEHQLNEPFPFDTPFAPFRFFLISSREETCYLGLAYFHAIADAESIGRLLLEIAAACLGRPSSAGLPEVLQPGRALKAPLGHPWKALQRAAGAFEQFQRMRRSHRPPQCETNDFRNRFLLRTLDEEETRTALTDAKRYGVTLNDLCLAALLLSVAPLTKSRFQTLRPQLTAACVVNLRSGLREQDQERFGLCLGTFTLTHPVPDGISLESLARDIRKETEAIKRHKLYLGAALTFRVSRFMLSRMPLEKQRNFYRKSYPVWGSITNRRVDDLCLAHGVPEVVDYFRAVSSGPAMPFVISVTGIAGRLNLGISFKPNVMPPEKMDAVVQRFLAFLTT